MRKTLHRIPARLSLFRFRSVLLLRIASVIRGKHLSGHGRSLSTAKPHARRDNLGHWGEPPNQRTQMAAGLQFFSQNAEIVPRSGNLPTAEIPISIMRACLAVETIYGAQQYEKHHMPLCYLVLICRCRAAELTHNLLIEKAFVSPRLSDRSFSVCSVCHEGRRPRRAKVMVRVRFPAARQRLAR